MAGLLSMPQQGAPSGAPQNQPAPAGGPAAPASQDDTDEPGEQPNVSPEEQAQYDKFVTNGFQVIYGEDPNKPKVRDDVLNRLSESSDPMENLANTTVWLVTMLETSAEQGGTQLDDAVVMHGGKALLEELAEVSEAAKIHDYSEKELEGAWYRGLDLYRETATQQGRIDPDQLKQQFGEIEQADKAGRIQDVLPGFNPNEEEAENGQPDSEVGPGEPHQKGAM